jgi:hypothetical protein
MTEGMPTDNVCDKCGRPVAPRNNAVVYQAEAGDISWDIATLTQPRHLAPEDSCEGSPSRFQHITGQPDQRGFPRPTLESMAAWRSACCRINWDDCPGWCPKGGLGAAMA